MPGDGAARGVRAAEREVLEVHTPNPLPRPRAAADPSTGDGRADGPRDGPAPGVLSADGGYVVLPRALAEAMPVAWQQAMARLVAELHSTSGHLPWPIYRVVASRVERLVDLDEGQLAEAGYLVELDATGELVYRDREGRPVPEAERHRVLVPCPDPLRRPPASRPG